MRLILTGRVDLFHLETILENDIETYENEAELPINAINKVADSLPAFGIVAAVMGVVHTMESIGAPPAQLGGLIARALVGTFLGVLIGYGFTGPVAAALDTQRQAVVKVLQSVKVVLLASTNNFAPTIAVELARKVLYSDSRPNSRELEEILKDLKTNRANPTMSDDHTTRYVIKRIKKVHGKHHGGAWKIAYADFITAMMAFFLLMWLLSLLNKYQMQGISNYFKKPLQDAFTQQDNISHKSTPKPIVTGAPSDKTKEANGTTEKQKPQTADETTAEEIKETLEAKLASDPTDAAI